MAQCSWCDKSLPGDDIPACSSCLLSPPPQDVKFEKIGDSEEVDSSHDLSYLDDRGNKNRLTKSDGKNYYQVMSDLNSLATKKSAELREEDFVKLVRVQSNHIRNRAVPIGPLVLVFDRDGIAEVPESELYLLENYMRVRPNRLRVLDEPSSEEPSIEFRLEEARNALREAKLVEEPEEVVVEEEPVEATPEPKKEAPKSKSKGAPRKKRGPNKKKKTRKKTSARKKKTTSDK